MKHEQEKGLVHVYVLLTYLTRPRLYGVVIPKESMGAIAETENHIDLFIFFKIGAELAKLIIHSFFFN